MTHTLPDGQTLYYEIHGPEAATQTLLFLNGLSQSTLAWAGLMPLAQQFRIVLADVVGQGQSPAAKEPRSFEEHAADVADLLQKLNFGKVTVIGLSYGGAVSLRLLANHQQLLKGGILLSAFGNKNAYFNALGESWVSALQCGGYALMLDVMLPIVLGKSYFEKPLIAINLLKNSKAGQSPSPENLMKLMHATHSSGNFLPELNRVQVPVLIMHGEEDTLCTPEMGQDMHRAIANSQLQILPKVGHTLNLEAIPQITQAIKDFVNRL